jgi:1-acyl-sn-glycerol-3-phosphate acyltransferase
MSESAQTFEEAAGEWRPEDLPEGLSGHSPAFIRANAPGMWLLSTLWFRAEVRGLEGVPPTGPVLLVSNHSGGNMTPDSIVLSLAWAAYFGVDRPLHSLAHAMVVRFPGLGGFLKRFGVVEARPQSAEALLHAGSSVLVYPGGDVDVHRPWTARHEVRFDGRTGWVRLAKKTGVPIVPVAAVGGHDTYLALTDGRWLASRLRLDKLLRLKVLPVSLALPWIVNVGDFAGHIPFPAKIRVELLPPRTVGPDDDEQEVYDEVVALLEEKVAALAAERVLPPFR